MRVVSALIDGGQAAEATRVFERILPLFHASPPVEEGGAILKTLVWQQIAIIYAKLGEVDGVHQAETQAVLDQLPDTGMLSIAWPYLAEVQLQAGDVAGARQTASQADDIRIVRAQAEHGDVAGAQVGLTAFDRWWALSGRARAQASIYKTTQAHPDHQAAVRAVAKARVVAGDIWATLEWARKYPYPDLKAYALIGFAEGLLAQQNQAP